MKRFSVGKLLFIMLVVLVTFSCWPTKACAQASNYEAAAIGGDAEAQFQLGLCYDRGNGVTKDAVKAAEWYRKSALQGNAKAIWNMAVKCEYGEGGLEKNKDKATELYKLAFPGLATLAEQGDLDAQNYLGECYYYGNGVTKDLAKAVEWYRKSAEQGDANAQYNLGYCYDNGDGVTKDLAKAVEWYRKSAEQGDADAQYNLGSCYYYGDGVTKDLAKAVEWYRKSAEQGDANAQNNLGYCYENGEGVTKDLAKAVELYRKSAEQGNALAQSNLGDCYYKCWKDAKYLKAVAQVDWETYELDAPIYYILMKYREKAVEWYKKAAEQGNAYAQCSLGICYENGKGVTKDLAKAVELYRKSAEQGNAGAQCNLGYCYENGYGVTKDLAKAVEWYRKSAEQGDADAQCNLGYCYEKGMGVTKNIKTAVQWYRKAAAQGNERAKNNLKALGVNM